MEFFIKRCGKRFVVEDSAGSRHTEPLSHEAAQAARDGLEAAAERERIEQRENDPEVLKRRAEKAAYRLAERDPWLRFLKNFLPRKGEIARNTQESYDRLMRGEAPPELKAINEQRVKDGLTPYPVFSFEKCMSITSSDPQVHAELNKTPGQRRTSSAANARRRQGKREQVLALTQSGMRQVDIAAKLDLSARQVRNYQKGK